VRDSPSILLYDLIYLAAVSEIETIVGNSVTAPVFDQDAAVKYLVYDTVSLSFTTIQLPTPRTNSFLIE
jgi:hypothetical protein